MPPKPSPSAKLPDSHHPSGSTVRTSAALGAVVRARRKSQALKQIDLAGLGNTGNRFIVDVESGKPTVQLQKVLDLLHLLGLEVVIRTRSAPLP